MDARSIGLLAVAGILISAANPALAEDAKKDEPKAEKAQEAAKSAISSKTIYYRLLARKSAATIEDAIRALTRYKGGPDELQPLAKELELLDKAGIKFPKNIARRKDETLTMGMAAHMLMKALDRKGGQFMYRLFPNSQRYTLKEAMAVNLIPSGSFVDQTLSGNDLIGLLVRMNEVNQEQKKETPKESKGY